MGIDRCLRRLRRLKAGVRRCEMKAVWYVLHQA